MARTTIGCKALYVDHLAQVERFLSQRACFSTLNLSYTEMLANPKAEVACIDTFLGGGLDVERMAAVADQALYRNRRSPPR